MDGASLLPPTLPAYVCSRTYVFSYIYIYIYIDIFYVARIILSCAVCLSSSIVFGVCSQLVLLGIMLPESSGIRRGPMGTFPFFVWGGSVCCHGRRSNGCSIVKSAAQHRRSFSLGGSSVQGRSNFYSCIISRCLGLRRRVPAEPLGGHKLLTKTSGHARPQSAPEHMLVGAITCVYIHTDAQPRT